MKDYPYPMQARNEALCPFTRDTQLSGFLTLPKSLLCWGLSPGALLVYGLLLDRGKLSQRSGWTDKQGWVYVIFPVRELALALGKGVTTIKRWLRELEERELIFRTVYYMAGCTKTMKRLWISSMEDEAIKKGIAELRPGREYDGLYQSALCRARADWLVGINATRLFSVLYHRTLNVGRVMTPTLALIVQREAEIGAFRPEVFYAVNLRCGDFAAVSEKFKEKAEADALAAACAGQPVTVKAVKRTEKTEKAPLLYDLTALQKDCNVHLDLPAAKTLDIAQSLYEKKLISYPRTGSRYIPHDVMACVPGLLERIMAMPGFATSAGILDFARLNTRSVDDRKVTDHHALITTGIAPEGLSEAETAVYTLIAGRMLEAFSPYCEKEMLLMECRLEGMDFRSKGSTVVSPGWRGIFGRKEDREDDEPETDEGTAVFAEGDTVPVSGFGLAQKKTVPRPLYTEATLLAAMETCGREIADEQAREAVKELGIGTPATRAAIITTLFKRDYIARSGKSIVPTEKGLHIYDAVKDMLVADVSLTGSWEKTLLQIERHTLGPDTFMASITDYTRKATREILNLSLPAAAARTFTCPKCKTGHIIVREKSARCDNKGCGLTVYRRFLNKELTDQHLEQLFSSGSTRLIKGFKGKKGVAFDASVTFDAGFTLTLSFPKNGNGRKRK